MLSMLYSVFDAKALFYSPPFIAANDGVATRMFMEIANDKNTSVGRHPRDYSLFAIAQFDDASGAIVSILPVRHVADAIALQQQQTEVFRTEVEANVESSVTRPNGEAR